MYLDQKMRFSTREVADQIYLPRWKFYLTQTTGEPLMLHPATTEINIEHWNFIIKLSMLIINCTLLQHFVFFVFISNSTQLM